MQFGDIAARKLHEGDITVVRIEAVDQNGNARGLCLAEAAAANHHTRLTGTVCAIWIGKVPQPSPIRLGPALIRRL